MRTETKVIKIYKFDELSKDIQENLIEKEKEYQLNAYCENFLLEDMEEEAKRLLQKYFGDRATFKAVYYDLSYCQGSGAMIEFDLIYYNKHVTIKQYGHYYHENSFTIIENYGEELTEKQYEQLKSKIYWVNKEFAKAGYNFIEWRETEEEAREFLRENEYLEGGIIY